MKFRRLIPVVASSLLMAIALNAYAQEVGDPVRDVQDLVGVRGRDGESELEQRGYEYRWAEQSGDAVYSYWTQSGSGQCIIVRTDNGRYTSLVYAGGTTDCDRGDSTSTQSSAPSALQDLVGARAGQAEGEVQRRGYTYRRNERISDTSVASFWIEGNSGQCVEIVTSDGRFQEILYADWYHCAD